MHTLKVLYLAAYALEHHEEGMIFSDPYDGYWSFFAEQFKARGIRRPARPEEWRQFFNTSSYPTEEGKYTVRNTNNPTQIKA